MTVTPSSVIRAAGLAAAASGALFIGIQIGHPHMDAQTIDTTQVVVRDTLKIVMASLALAGITGMYARQVRQAGVLGLVGYLLMSVGYLLVLGTVFTAAFVLPTIADVNPGFVDDMTASANTGSAVGDIGLMAQVLQVQGAAYLLGGVVFGIALLRAGVLSRWASILLAVGGLVSAALTLMPDAFHRLLAFPNGIAMIGLGWSLWRSLSSSDDAVAVPEPPVAVPSR
ncbi:MAG: hypothetical protein U0R80_19000 [Nocardioidaceae bacterium]